jgi:hypothetical protein
MPRRAQLAAIAVAAAAAAAAVGTIAPTDDRPAPQVRTVAAPAQPGASRYFDLEANKAASMRALGEQLAGTRTDPVSRFEDIEANKARSQSAR